MSPENRRRTGALTRDGCGRFRRGVSGNPGGRPRSISAVILEQRPTVSQDLVDFWSLVTFGSAAAVKRKFGVAPRMADRLAAAVALADRVHGRPVPAEERDERPQVPVFILPPGTTGVDVDVETLEDQDAPSSTIDGSGDVELPRDPGDGRRGI